MRIDKNILLLAKKQFCLDCNCLEGKNPTQLGKHGIHINRAKKLPGARIYHNELFFRAITSFGELFIMADETIYPWAKEFFKDASPEWFCSFKNLREIDRKMNEHGREILDTHIHFLPDMDAGIVEPICNVKWYEKDEILPFKEKNPFGNALMFSETQPDMLAVAAFDKEKMIGMAGASADGKYMWQIGIDVLPEYRGHGLAANLTALIKQEIIRRKKVPFYGTSESHSVSQSVAIKAGFLPAWAEIFTHKLPMRK